MEGGRERGWKEGEREREEDELRQQGGSARKRLKGEDEAELS